MVNDSTTCQQLVCLAMKPRVKKWIKWIDYFMSKSLKTSPDLNFSKSRYMCTVLALCRKYHAAYWLCILSKCTPSLQCQFSEWLKVVFKDLVLPKYLHWRDSTMQTYSYLICSPFCVCSEPFVFIIQVLFKCSTFTLKSIWIAQSVVFLIENLTVLQYWFYFNFLWLIRILSRQRTLILPFVIRSLPQRRSRFMLTS